ncbi:MAG TPA: SCP2 sterol-binding domain-containing protein [Acidimicrobiales bacterium]
MVRYLSLDWIDALRTELSRRDDLAEIASERTVGVTQVVTDGPEGDVVYHLQAAGGEVSFGAGPADPEDVRFQQTWEVAVSVAQGVLNAQEAFLGGRILISGDRQKLLDNTALFAALDEVFATVREHTTYE